MRRYQASNFINTLEFLKCVCKEEPRWKYWKRKRYPINELCLCWKARKFIGRMIWKYTNGYLNEETFWDEVSYDLQSNKLKFVLLVKRIRDYEHK